VVAAVVVGLLAAQCDRAEPPAPPSQASPPPAPPEPPPIPKPAALTRADMLRALAAAASDFATGAKSAEPSITGRTFAIRTAFGCSGPRGASTTRGGDGLARWDWGPERKSIRLSLTLADWTTSAQIVREGEDAGWDAVEGAWIPRPWADAETCPPAPPVVAPPPAPPTGAPPTGAPPTGAPAAGSPAGGASPVVAPSPGPVSVQTAGLAAIHEAKGSRLERRNGRAYTYTVNGEDDAPAAPPTQGYRLLLEGRVMAFPDGQPIRCSAAGPDQRPTCIAAVKLDKVAFEDGATGATLSEWGPG
jgi:hypothetical protein